MFKNIFGKKSNRNNTNRSNQNSRQRPYRDPLADLGEFIEQTAENPLNMAQKVFQSANNQGPNRNNGQNSGGFSFDDFKWIPDNFNPFSNLNSSQAPQPSPYRPPPPPPQNPPSNNPSSNSTTNYPSNPSSNRPNSTPNRNPSSTPTTPQNQNQTQNQTPLQQYRSLGNSSFRQGDYPSALEYYTLCISLDDSDQAIFLNRALTLKNMGLWKEAKKDVFRAEEVGGESLKGTVLLAECLFELAKMVPSWEERQQAYEKCQRVVKRARGIDKEKHQEEHKGKLIQLAKVIAEQQESDIETSEKLAKEVPANPHSLVDLLKATLPGGVTCSVLEQIDKIGEIDRHNKVLQTFRKKEGGSKPGFGQSKDIDPPECLTCPLTLELFDEPLVVSSGQTYDKVYLSTHLSSASPCDPLSRKPLRGPSLPNKALKAECLRWKEQTQIN